MFKLKLIKGRSYTGHGVSVNAMSPFVEVEKKDVSDALAASGYFSFVEELANTNGDDGKGANDKPLDKMTEKELDAYAEENGIDLAGLSKKADKLAKIQQVLAEGGSDDLFNNED